MEIAMLLQRSSRFDSRVLREARALAAAGHRVTIVELAAGPRTPEPVADGVARVSALPPPRLKRLIPFKLHRLVSGFAIARAAARLRPDVIHAHDVAMLPSGWLAARRAGALLVYDTHEFALGVAYRTRAFALLVRVVERLFVPRADAAITVSDGIAERLASIYRLRRPPVVVRNTADASGAVAGPGLREELRLPPETPLVLHQGAPARHRGCATLAHAVERLDGVHLVFLGEVEPEFMTQLRAGTGGRVHFVPARPPEQLLAATGEADVGVTLLEDVCENHRLALPNKVFEYVAAGVTVVSSDLPELRGLVERYGIGELVDPADPQSVADGIRAALATPRTDALAAAARELSWDLEQRRLRDLYADLAQARGRAPRRPGRSEPA
jgi:glycosyltransferase involved in cell wall biosynthesis